MDGSHYDVVVCGTGLKECILSGLLSKKGESQCLNEFRNEGAPRGPELLLRG